MVSEHIKQRMAQFIAERLTANNLLEMIESDINHVLVTEKRIWKQNPKRTSVLLHHGSSIRGEIKEQKTENKSLGIYTADVFLKDGKTFAVKLGRRAYYKARRSLKNYPPVSRNKIIHLRRLEQDVLNEHRLLTYYQPQEEFIPEMLITAEMQPVYLSYSHIPEDDKRRPYVWNRQADVFKLPNPLTFCDEKRFATITYGSNKSALVWRANYHMPEHTLFR